MCKSPKNQEENVMNSCTNQIQILDQLAVYLCHCLHRKIDAFELWCWRRLESPLDIWVSKSVSPKGNQPWVFIGRTDAAAVILWPPDAKSQLIGKDSDSGKDWRQEEKGTIEDEMVGWYQWMDRLDGQEFGQSPGVGQGQGRSACCSPWGRKESDTTERLNWFSLILRIICFQW